MSHSSPPTSSHRTRPLTERAFTIRNIQTIAKFACKAYTRKSTILLAYVNQDFSETMKDFHTAVTVLLDHETYQGEISLDSSSASSLIRFAVRYKLTWLMEELFLEPGKIQSEYDQKIKNLNQNCFLPEEKEEDKKKGI